MYEGKYVVKHERLSGGVERRRIFIGAIAISAPTFVSCTTEDGWPLDDVNTGGGAGGGGLGGPRGVGGEDTGMLDPSMFDEAQRCTLTAADIEGPCFIDDSEFPADVRLFRSDIREGHPGCELRFYCRLLDAQNNCEPIPDAEVYIRHCDANGDYSGPSKRASAKRYGGSAKRTANGDKRFCRGVQLSDRNGIVGFTTIYPGWYPGRPVHVHLIARLNGQAPRLIDTHFYFPADVSRQVFENEPAYKARSRNIPQDSLDPQFGLGGPTIHDIEYTPGSGLAVATLNLLVSGPQA